MNAFPIVESSASAPAFASLDRLFEAAKKTTIIQLRWPLVILCCYLLLYSPNILLTPTQTHAFLLFYILTNATLYLIVDEIFESPCFYGPLLFFDTIVLAAALYFSGGATPDFYLACFFTLVLSCICNDSRGLLVVTLLAPLLYAYVVFNSALKLDPSIYLRLPFPLVISLFYGYFAQVERLRRVARENEEQARRDQRAAEEIRRQRQRLEVLHEVNVGVTSTINTKKIMNVLLERVSAYLPYDSVIVRLRDLGSGAVETAGAKGIGTVALDEWRDELGFIDNAMEARRPLMIDNLAADARRENLDFLGQEGFTSFLAVPLVANDQVMGSLSFLTREERNFSGDEIDFLSTMAGQAALAIHHSQLFQKIEQQANELRHANKAKDEFIGVVSHELKTPLNVILGYSNMLLEKMLGEISPIQEKALHTIARQSKELHVLINSVLQVSSIEAGMVEIHEQEVNLWEFVSEMRAAFDFPLAKDIKMIWEYPEDLPTVQVDQSKLRHILQNLINNAIKFTERGSVTVVARYLNAKKAVEFKVIDTGIGIPKSQLQVVFERFRQLDSSDTRAYGGVGLGLYIVKQFTTLLRGKVAVESSPGKGSTFVVQIPCQPTSKRSQHSKLGAGGSETVNDHQG
jgi:signal transduction histidine kinase